MDDYSKYDDGLPPRPFEEITVGSCHVQTATDRFGTGAVSLIRSRECAEHDGLHADEDDPETMGLAKTVPKMPRGRNNLTALSQRYNLYFIAYDNRIFVYRPRSVLRQKTPRQPDARIYTVPSKAGKTTRGHINTRRPHLPNNLVVGQLGNDEVLVVAFDNGDVLAFFTHIVAELIHSRGQTVLDSRPLFHENVGRSAWGIAIHQKSRLIAVSSNRHEVTVFAFGLNQPGTVSKDESTPPISSAEDLVRRRSRNWRIIIALGTGADNIPHISFVDDANGQAEKIVAVDINGKTWILDIWKAKTAAIGRSSSSHTYHYSAGWGALALPDSCFVPVSNVDQLFGMDYKQVIEDKLSPNHPKTFDISNSLLDVRGNPAMPERRPNPRKSLNPNSGEQLFNGPTPPPPLPELFFQHPTAAEPYSTPPTLDPAVFFAYITNNDGYDTATTVMMSDVGEDGQEQHAGGLTIDADDVVIELEYDGGGGGSHGGGGGGQDGEQEEYEEEYEEYEEEFYSGVPLSTLTAQQVPPPHSTTTNIYQQQQDAQHEAPTTWTGATSNPSPNHTSVIMGDPAATATGTSQVGGLVINVAGQPSPVNPAYDGDGDSDSLGDSDGDGSDLANLHANGVPIPGLGPLVWAGWTIVTDSRNENRGVHPLTKVSVSEIVAEEVLGRAASSKTTKSSAVPRRTLMRLAMIYTPHTGNIYRLPSQLRTWQRLFKRRPDSNKNAATSADWPDARLARSYSILSTYDRDVALTSLDPSEPFILCQNPMPLVDACKTYPLGEQFKFSRRINMVIHVPELSLVVVGSQVGRVMLITPTRMMETSQERVVRRAFRVDKILPEAQDDRARRNPMWPLFGIAVGPVQERVKPGSIQLHEDGQVWSGPGRTYRLLLHFRDHTILSYELSRSQMTGMISVI